MNNARRTFGWSIFGGLLALLWPKKAEAKPEPCKPPQFEFDTLKSIYRAVDGEWLRIKWEEIRVGDFITAFCEIDGKLQIERFVAHAWEGDTVVVRIVPDAVRQVAREMGEALEWMLVENVYGSEKADNAFYLYSQRSEKAGFLQHGIRFQPRPLHSVVNLIKTAEGEWMFDGGEALEEGKL